MKNVTMQMMPFVAGLAMTVLGSYPVLADTVSETSTTSSTTSSTCPVQSFGSAPFMVVTDSCGQPTFVGSESTLQVVPVITTGITITGVRFYAPKDDLFCRRDDLLARIMTERGRGELSSADANDLVNRVMAVDALRAQLPARTETECFYKQVHRIYRQYDALSNDIGNASDQGDKDLAGTYNYMVF